MYSPLPDSRSSESNAPDPASSDRTKAIEMMKSMYQTAQQAEYLHLQAETELLLQQLQALQQRRIAVS
jgi:hypothetical protein